MSKRSGSASHAAGSPNKPARPSKNQAPAAPRVPIWPGIAVSILCAVVYLRVGVGQFGVRSSQFCHHVLTANAWLHGRLYVTHEEIARSEVLHTLRRNNRPIPADAELNRLIQLRMRPNVHHHDWFEFGAPGRYFAYWPPIPALLMLPAVLISGPDASDILVDNLVGALSVLCMYLILRELNSGWTAITTPACAAVALFYGLGTCHFWQACVGQVWFLTQLTGTLFLMLAIWFALRARRRIGWLAAASAALGLGFLSRNTIILAVPFLVVVLWLIVRAAPDRFRKFSVWNAIMAGILLVSIGIQFGFNKIRFGDWLDSGQEHLADAGAGGNPRFRDDFQKYGRFNLHYVPRNLFYYFANYEFPLRATARSLERPNVVRTFDPDGNSLFVISPLMIYMFLAWRRRDPVAWAILAGAIPGTTALMLFHGTGFFTFGPRYLLDTLPLLVMLAALGMRGRLTAVAVGLIVISIAANSWGTYRFCAQQPP